LVAGTAAWVLIGAAIGGVGLSLAFRRTAEGAFEKRLDSLLLAVIGTIDVPPAEPARVSRLLADALFDRPYSGWYWQVDDGAERLRSRSLWDAVLPVDPLSAAPEVREMRGSGPRGEALRMRVRSLQYPSRAEPVVVAVAGPEAEVTEEIGRFDRLLALSLSALTLGLAVTLAVQLGYGLRPLRRLAAELAAVRGGRAPRLRGEYPSEIQPLVQAMNEVLDHDAGLIERARTHVGNLAHGLKTPLAVLAGETANPSRESAARIGEQTAIMSRLVDHHLARAAAAGARRVLGARTELAPVAAALRDTLARLYADRRVAIDLSIARDTAFAGERQDLEELLGTVLDNACKWATAGVRLSAHTSAGQVHLTIEDDGPGLSSEQAERAVARGTRLDDDTPGSGLGLSIAGDLAALYGGSLGLGRSELGGLRVQIELPAA
jgi:signal transduction histidine kinase